MMKRIVLSIAIVFFSLGLMASGERLTRSQYIDVWKDEAIYQMVVHKIPASITLAQGILESGDGNSELASLHNNHFGIKCHSAWEGGKTYHDDDKKGECFRVYPNAHESFEDHSLFLKKNRYSSLFELKITDYKGWARGLKKCGYATNPKYAQRLIEIIESNGLDAYDKLGTKYIKQGEMPPRSYIPLEPKEELVAEKKQERKKRKHSVKDDNLPNVTVSLDRALKVSDNNIRYVVIKDGDSFESLAAELEVMPWQIKRYNDISSDYKFTSGEQIYIQPKRNKAKKAWHTVKEGETMWQISQDYGIKLKKLYQKNNMTQGSEPTAGQKLSLKKQLSTES